MIREDTQQAFGSWLDGVLSADQPSAVAYSFNLYEHVEDWAIQVVGTSRFDVNDPDWAADEAFSSGEDLFLLAKAVTGDDWQEGLAAAKSLVSTYLRIGAHAGRLRNSEGVGIAFVDGDLELLRP